MALKQRGQKTYRSMQGKQVDMDMLRQRNELTQAVGNARVNARGDELGPGGKIIRKKEELDADYYADNPASMPNEEAQVENIAEPVVAETPVQVQPTRTRAQQKVQQKVEAPVEKDLTDDWEEDDDGNFVQKGK
jgi:hypothetical protein|tara:strand:- start:2339 stop:2740 length:402 start_codon:yes stop_codon:yes gene_type:complete